MVKVPKSSLCWTKCPAQFTYSACFIKHVAKFNGCKVFNNPILPSYTNYLQHLKNFSADESSFKLLHLNINSLFLKGAEVNLALELQKFDLFFLNETKLDSSIPQSFLTNKAYRVLRRDRTGLGGGVMVLLKNLLSYSAINVLIRLK